MSYSRSRTNDRHHQLGAIGLWGALALLMAVLFTALAVDSSRLWMQQRKLQSIADLAAIEAARTFGCTSSLPAALATAQSSAENNGFSGDLSQSPNQVSLTRVATDKGGIRQISTKDKDKQAVLVRATQQVANSLFARGYFSGSITLSAEAVAIADPTMAAFSAGNLVGLQSEDALLLNKLLGGALGGSINLDVSDYQAITAAHLSLFEILQAHDPSISIESLLTANISINNLLTLIRTATEQNGSADAQALAAMQNMINATSLNANLKLESIIEVAFADKDAASHVRLNALSLINTATIFAKGSKKTIAMTFNVADIPHVSSINANVVFNQLPKIAIGPAASTPCSSLLAAGLNASVSLLLTIPDLNSNIDMGLFTTVNQGTAGLLDITQNNGESDLSISANNAAATLQLLDSAGKKNSRTEIIELPKKLIGEISLSLTQPAAGSQTLDFSIPHPLADNLPQTESKAGSLGDSLENVLAQQSNLDIDINSNPALVNEIVTTIISPLLGEIGRVFLDPLFKVLGTPPGGMDVTVEGLQYRRENPLAI